MEMPRKYVSWSAMSLWEKSRSEWIKRYMQGKSLFETEALRLGKSFAGDLELGLSNDEDTQLIIDMLPKMEANEVEITAMLGKIKLLGKMDIAGPKGFREVKTGKVPWDQNRVDNHGQLDFYALIHALNGSPVEEIWLDWIPTSDGKLTGAIKSFKREVTEKNLEDMKKRIKKYVKEVKNYKVISLKD